MVDFQISYGMSEFLCVCFHCVCIWLDMLSRDPIWYGPEEGNASMATVRGSLATRKVYSMVEKDVLLNYLHTHTIQFTDPNQKEHQ